MAVFSVLVQNILSQPIVGAGIRLFSPDAVDVTAARFGASPVYTDSGGRFSRSYSGTSQELIDQGLPAGDYQILISAPGYQPLIHQTGDNFIGYGTYTIGLDAVSVIPDVLITQPASGFVSPMAPVEAIVPGVATSAPWEAIVARVTNLAGEASIIEVPVIGGEARINLQARLSLEPNLHLVGDDDLAIVDPDFSDKFFITLASLSRTGSVDLDASFAVFAANAFPPGDTNDLTEFTNAEGLADWLTPWGELPKFKGHVADAMIWLPYPSPSQYQLKVDWKDLNKVALSTDLIDLPGEVFGSGKAVKIRIPEPIPGARYAVLTVLLGSVAQSKPLTVRYHG